MKTKEQGHQHFKKYLFGFWTHKMECVILQPENFQLKIIRPDGGIGRRSRLKICRSQGCAGSIPVPGTKPLRKEWFFYLPGCQTKKVFGGLLFFLKV